MTRSGVPRRRRIRSSATRRLGLEPVVEARCRCRGGRRRPGVHRTPAPRSVDEAARLGQRDRPQGAAADRRGDGPAEAGPGPDRDARSLQQPASRSRPTPRPGSAPSPWSCCRAPPGRRRWTCSPARPTSPATRRWSTPWPSIARVLPMMMTAAGTVTPAKVFIVGAGVAGLQAIATARRMGAVVTATDVRPAAREETESLGAKFVGFVPERRRDQGRLCPAADARGAGRAGEDGGRAPQGPGHRRHHRADPRPQGAADHHRRDGASR